VFSSIKWWSSSNSHRIHFHKCKIQYPIVVWGWFLDNVLLWVTPTPLASLLWTTISWTTQSHTICKNKQHGSCWWNIPWTYILYLTWTLFQTCYNSTDLSPSLTVVYFIIIFRAEIFDTVTTSHTTKQRWNFYLTMQPLARYCIKKIWQQNVWQIPFKILWRKLGN